MEKPIRVLNVVGTMGYGGAETSIMDEYRNIDRSKVQFDFLIHKPTAGPYKDEILELGGKIYYMPVLSDDHKVYYWRFFQYIKALNTFFKNHLEISIVHGHMTNTATIYMPIARKYSNIKSCIAHSHNAKATPGLMRIVTDQLQKKIPRVATDYLAVSKKAAEWIFSDELINSGKVKILYSGIDTQRFKFNTEIRSKWRRKLNVENKIVIGNVSRFKKPKNHSFMIDVLEELVKLDDNIILMLVGDGELKDEIVNKVREKHLEKYVRFEGTSNEVEKYMNAFDLFFLPSFYEGLPRTGVEAQDCGLPVVCSSEITDELNVTGNVTFIDLNQSASCWANIILQIEKKFDRKDTSQTVRNSGFDIIDTTKWLQNFYLSKVL